MGKVCEKIRQGLPVEAGALYAVTVMNCCSSSGGAYDLGGMYNPCRVRILERKVYSQLVNAAFPCSFGHEDTIRMSLNLPCSLCPVIAVHICSLGRLASHFFLYCRGMCSSNPYQRRVHPSLSLSVLFLSACSDRSPFQKFVRSWPYSGSSLNQCLLSSIIIPFRLDSSFFWVSRVK
jgi:hypothetical protein